MVKIEQRCQVPLSTVHNGFEFGQHIPWLGQEGSVTPGTNHALNVDYYEAKLKMYNYNPAIAGAAVSNTLRVLYDTGIGSLGLRTNDNEADYGLHPKKFNEPEWNRLFFIEANPAYRADPAVSIKFNHTDTGFQITGLLGGDVDIPLAAATDGGLILQLLKASNDSISAAHGATLEGTSMYPINFIFSAMGEQTDYTKVVLPWIPAASNNGPQDATCYSSTINYSFVYPYNAVPIDEGGLWYCLPTQARPADIFATPGPNPTLQPYDNTNTIVGWTDPPGTGTPLGNGNSVDDIATVVHTVDGTVWQKLKKYGFVWVDRFAGSFATEQGCGPIMAHPQWFLDYRRSLGDDPVKVKVRAGNPGNYGTAESSRCLVLGAAIPAGATSISASNPASRWSEFAFALPKRALSSTTLLKDWHQGTRLYNNYSEYGSNDNVIGYSTGSQSGIRLTVHHTHSMKASSSLSSRNLMGQDYYTLLCAGYGTNLGISVGSIGGFFYHEGLGINTTTGIKKVTVLSGGFGYRSYAHVPFPSPEDVINGEQALCILYPRYESYTTGGYTFNNVGAGLQVETVKINQGGVGYEVGEVPTITVGEDIARSTDYEVRDQAHIIESGVRYVCTCITAGTTAGSAPTFGTNTGDTTTDGTVVWRTAGRGAIGTAIMTQPFIGTGFNLPMLGAIDWSYAGFGYIQPQEVTVSDPACGATVAAGGVWEAIYGAGSAASAASISLASLQSRMGYPTGEAFVTRPGSGYSSEIGELEIELPSIRSTAESADEYNIRDRGRKATVFVEIEKYRPMYIYDPTEGGVSTWEGGVHSPAVFPGLQDTDVDFTPSTKSMVVVLPPGNTPSQKAVYHIDDFDYSFTMESSSVKSTITGGSGDGARFVKCSFNKDTTIEGGTTTGTGAAGSQDQWFVGASCHWMTWDGYELERYPSVEEYNRLSRKVNSIRYPRDLPFYGNTSIASCVSDIFTGDQLAEWGTLTLLGENLRSPSVSEVYILLDVLQSTDGITFTEAVGLQGVDTSKPVDLSAIDALTQKYLKFRFEYNWNPLDQYDTSQPSRSTNNGKTPSISGWDLVYYGKPTLQNFEVIQNTYDILQVGANNPSTPLVLNSEVGEVVTFKAKGIHLDTTQEVVEFKFDFGDGYITDWLPPTTFDVNDLTCTISHAYSRYNAAAYQVRVKCRDDRDNESDWTTGIHIQVASVQPVAIAYAHPVVVAENESINLFSGDSYDPDSQFVVNLYEWTINGVVSTTAATTTTTTIATDGIYDITLRCRNDNNVWSEFVNVRIHVTDPIVATDLNLLLDPSEYSISEKKAITHIETLSGKDILKPVSGYKETMNISGLFMGASIETDFATMKNSFENSTLIRFRYQATDFQGNPVTKFFVGYISAFKHSQKGGEAGRITYSATVIGNSTGA